MDTSQWPQEIVVKSMKQIIVPKKKNTNTRKIRPHHQQQNDQALKNCPRCNSTNTKFCYYNNYNLSQPSFFARIVEDSPIGGVSRISKKSSSNIMKNNIISPKVQDIPPNKGVDQDLTLDFSSDFKIISELIQVPNNSFMPMPNVSDPNSIYLFSSTLDHGLIGSSSTSGGYECNNIIQDCKCTTTTIRSGGFLFPFEDLKQVSNTSEQNRDGESSTGYSNAILGGNCDLDTTTYTMYFLGFEEGRVMQTLSLVIKENNTFSI